MLQKARRRRTIEKTLQCFMLHEIQIRKYSYGKSWCTFVAFVIQDSYVFRIKVSLQKTDYIIESTLHIFTSVLLCIRFQHIFLQNFLQDDNQYRVSIIEMDINIEILFNHYMLFVFTNVFIHVIYACSKCILFFSMFYRINIIRI